MNLKHILNFKVQVYRMVTNVTFILPIVKIIHLIYILCSISCQIKRTMTKEKCKWFKCHNKFPGDT